MTRTVERAAEDLVGDLAALRQDVARLAESMSEMAKHQARTASARVSEAVEDAGDQIASTAADAERRVRAAGGEIEASIERHPLTAVLIAFSVGLSLGIVSRSRG